MDFKSLYIIAAQLWDTSAPSSEFIINNPEYAPLLSGEFTKYDATLKLLRSNMNYARSSGMTDCDLSKIPGFWKGKVARAYIRGKEDLDVFAWNIIIELQVDSLEEILLFPAGNRVDIIEKLLASLIPECNGKEIEPEYPRYPFCIYLEPETGLIQGSKSIEDVTDEAMDELKFKETVVRPSQLPDVLLLQSLCNVSDLAGFTAVGLEPMPATGSPNTIIIPFNIWKLFLLLTYAASLNYGVSSLKSLPFLNTDLNEYISYIDAEGKPLPRYEKKFLSDKQEEIALRVILDNRKREYTRDALEEFLIPIMEGNWDWNINIASRTHLLAYEYDLLSKISYTFDGLIREINELYTDLEYRSGLLSEILRDISTAHVNQTNLDLQKSVGSLTVRATWFAFFALVIGTLGWLLPREAIIDTIDTIMRRPTITSTVAPTDVFVISLTATIEDTDPLPTPTKTSAPAQVYDTLGSPFAPGCGDGEPIIWSNDSFNGPFRADGFGVDWGHVDWFVPEGCNIDTYEGEVVSPITGSISEYSMGYKISVPEGSYLLGTEDALKFAGIENPDLDLITKFELDIAHVDLITGYVTKGQSIGEVVWAAGHPKIGYQVLVTYENVEYMLSPTLFPHLLADGTILWPMLSGNSENWTCAKDSYARYYENAINDCVSEIFDYAP